MLSASARRLPALSLPSGGTSGQHHWLCRREGSGRLVVAWPPGRAPATGASSPYLHQAVGADSFIPWSLGATQPTPMVPLGHRSPPP